MITITNTGPIERVIYNTKGRAVKLPPGVAVSVDITAAFASRLERWGGIEIEGAETGAIDKSHEARALLDLEADMTTAELKEAAAEIIDDVPFRRNDVIDALTKVAENG